MNPDFGLIGSHCLIENMKSQIRILQHQLEVANEKIKKNEKLTKLVQSILKNDPLGTNGKVELLEFVFLMNK